MLTVMLFLHVVGAVGMGIYAIMPFVVGRFKQLSGTAQEGLASGLILGGRLGQYSLVLQLLTGGYLISNSEMPDYTVAWMVTIIVLFVAIGALTGIVQAPLKRIAVSSIKGESASSSIARVQTLSSIIFVLFLVMIWLMQDPWYVTK
jgi:peptidoglycan/LPS O-acetylase OafA/YrhL